MGRVAIEMDAYGGPEVLRPVAREPWEPGPDEVVVRAVASGVNRADLFIRSGAWRHAGAFPYVPGLEVAGVVERVGSAVQDLAPGDVVFTMMQQLGGIHGTRAGGYQSHVKVPAGTVARLPEGLDPVTAAHFGLPAVTAYLALRALDVQPGQRVLVHGGSGAVGMFALQLVVAAGAEALATGTSPAKFDLVRGFGAREVLDTRDPGWAGKLGQVDRVLDLVGRATFAATVAALAPGGRLVFAGGTSGGELAFSGWALMRPVTLTGYSSETLTRAELTEAAGALAALHAAGTLRCPAVTEFPLEQAAAAHRALESGELAGRVVLRPAAAPGDEA